MTVVLYEIGAFVLMAQHIHKIKKTGVYHYKRRIPEDMQKHHPNDQGWRRFSLRTKNPIEAAKMADAETRRLDALWLSLRSGAVSFSPEVVQAALALLSSYGVKPGEWEEWEAEGIEPDRFLAELDYQAGVQEHDTSAQIADRRKNNLPIVHRVAADMFFGKETPVFLSEALREYQDLKVRDTGTKSEQQRVRVVNEFISLFCDLPINQYTRDNANEFVRHLRDNRGNTPETIRRRLNSIGAIFTLMETEGKLEKRSPFYKLQIKGLGDNITKRLPFDEAELRTIQSLCVSKDDPSRWAIALMSDTGMRVAEVIGLEVQDVHLNVPVPFVDIRPTELRGLKADASERKVPLVGAALWAAKRAVENSNRGLLFSNYIDTEQRPPHCKSDSASGALNKWIRGQGVDKTCHCFRHSITDRLRQVGASEDLRNEIEGWKNRGVGAGYGSGHSLESKQKVLTKIVLADLFPFG